MPRPPRKLVCKNCGDYEAAFNDDIATNADRLGISRSAWAKYRSGERDLPLYIKKLMLAQIELNLRKG